MSKPKIPKIAKHLIECPRASGSWFAHERSAVERVPPNRKLSRRLVLIESEKFTQQEQLKITRKSTRKQIGEYEEN